MRNTLKRRNGKILKKSTIKRCQVSTFLRPDCHVNHSQPQTQLEIEGLPEKTRSFFSMYYDLSKLNDRSSYSLKMLQDYFPIRRGVALQHGSFIFKKWGTMRSGRILTARPSGCAAATNIFSSLGGIIIKSAPKKYYLKGKDLQYALSRLSRRNGRSFNVLLLKPGQGLIIAQLYLMSMDLEPLYQKKKRPYLGCLPGGPPAPQKQQEIECLEMFGHP